MNLPLNIDFQQILLHLFNFAILGFGLYILLYKPVKDFLEKRQEHYEAMDAEAKAALEKAREQEALYTKRLEEADEEISVKRREAAAKAKEMETLRMAEAEAKAAKLLANAHYNASRERDMMLAEARAEISEMAVAAVEKMMNESVSKAYDQFLTNVGDAPSMSIEPSALEMSEAEAKTAAFMAKARKEADLEHHKILAVARQEISTMAVEAVEKLSAGDLPQQYDNFLDAAERSVPDERG